jgi:hypothetical protein
MIACVSFSTALISVLFFVRFCSSQIFPVGKPAGPGPGKTSSLLKSFVDIVQPVDWS